MPSQRYVSPDLTHFVGRGLRSQEEQYALFRTILKERLLRARSPELPRLAAYALEIHPSARLSGNRAFRGSYVCFCDIPLEDLDLHMRKYSRFGVAFPKNFLLEKGATPVIYVPGRGRPALLPFQPYPRGRVRSNSVAFDEFWRRYQKLRDRMKEAQHGGDAQLARLFTDVRGFLDIHVLSHLKFFDPYLYDDDKKNYYMEREWRVMRQVRFGLIDVTRVVLPERFSRRFRRDFPRYGGQVTFA
jgi:hypothetical protein